LQELLDSIPILGVFGVFAIASLVVYEAGYRFGRWWQTRTPEESEGPTGMIVGSLLALMAFMLAITMGMAADRFDTRRGIILEEANSIGTTYLRAGYLPEPASSTTRELLREYVPLRIVPRGATDVRERLTRSAEINDELWLIAEALAISTPESDVLGLYIESLNDTIDVNTTRIIAALFARVPETVVFLLFMGSVLTLGMVGYGAGLTRRRSPLTAIVMIVVLGAVITLVVDLDRPADGFISISQQALTDLERQIGPPSS
jgi:hypothetical protein